MDKVCLPLLDSNAPVAVGIYALDDAVGLLAVGTRHIARAFDFASTAFSASVEAVSNP